MFRMFYNAFNRSQVSFFKCYFIYERIFLFRCIPYKIWIYASSLLIKSDLSIKSSAIGGYRSFNETKRSTERFAHETVYQGIFVRKMVQIYHTFVHCSSVQYLPAFR